MNTLNNIQNATQQEIEKLQKKQLEILIVFSKFCKENDINYTLAGGSLIGLIRHKGFIPWDDDIDIFMPRPDYEKFKELWIKNGDTSNYTYCRTDRNYMYHHPAATLKDNNTTFINSHSKNNDIHHGVGIDIIPIDAYAPGKISRFFQLLNASFFALFNTQRLPDNKGGIIKLLSKISLSIVYSKNMRYKIWSRCEKNMSKYDWDTTQYATELVGSIKGMMIKHPKSLFEDTITLQFDGVEVKAMKNYDEYLTLIFGDYMKLPDIEDRVAKHNTYFIDLNKSYKHYKGLKYCIENDVIKNERSKTY